MTPGRFRLFAAVIAVALAAACASNRPAPVVTSPRFPQYVMPEIPTTMRIAADVRQRYLAGWQRLQGGDLRGANRDYTEVLKKAPDLYPAAASLGFVLLADRQFKQADARFTAAVASNDWYLPGWLGKAEAQLGLGDDARAIAAMERILVLDPRRDAIRTRLDLVRTRQVQALIESGRRSRMSGKLDEARRLLEQAQELSPSSTLILRELSLVHVARGAMDDAEAALKKAIQLDGRDAELQAALGDVYEAGSKIRDAAAAYGRAVAIDARPEWRAKIAALREKADVAAIPNDFGALAAAPAITRAQTAAFVGIKLGGLVEKAPRRAAAVATDIRGHWATPWIIPVTQAGVMDVYANHTFQPSASVRRGDLAQIVSRLLALLPPSRTAEVTRWRAASPQLPDVSASNVTYRSVALAIAAGAMATDPDGRFVPTRVASGADLEKAVARIQQLSR